MSGEATVVTDRDVVRKYYNVSLKAWVGDLGDGVHNGGPEDPRLAIIRVVARTATYALAVGTSLGRAVEIVKGAVTGQAAQVNKLRELTEKELDECELASCALVFDSEMLPFGVDLFIGYSKYSKYHAGDPER